VLVSVAFPKMLFAYWSPVNPVLWDRFSSSTASRNRGWHLILRWLPGAAGSAAGSSESADSALNHKEFTIRSGVLV
jgi:hypothetical protein